MSTFKETIQNEISTVFLNSEEFGEVHNLEGQDHVIVEDSYVQSEKDFNDGLYLVTKVIYVKKADLNKEIKENMWIEYDGKGYNVLKIDDYMGMVAITLEGNRD